MSLLSFAAPNRCLHCFPEEGTGCWLQWGLRSTDAPAGLQPGSGRAQARAMLPPLVCIAQPGGGGAGALGPELCRVAAAGDLRFGGLKGGTSLWPHGLGV